MAKVKIQGHASGSGVLTVTAPNTSSDRTITLPDATGTLLNSDGSGASLTALNGTQVTSGTVPAARLPAGSVLQVVQAVLTSETTTTSTSFVTSAITAAITPSSSSNKILVRFSTPSYIDTSSAYVYFTIFRGTVAGTNLGHSTSGFAMTRVSGASSIASATGEYLDSPSTTSAQTYTIGMRVSSGTGASSVNAGHSTITLMEIAG